MDKKLIITIGRQFGSGGRDIGMKLAQIFGIQFYDNKLITEAAKRSGLSHEIFEKEDEKMPRGLMHALAVNIGFAPGFSTGFTQENIFKIQSDTIIDIASKGSCVIVGRCADYVLRDLPGCVNIFIKAPKEARINMVSARAGIETGEASDLIEKIDKSRASYYNFYTDKQWGACDSYHLSVDSSLLGMDGTAEGIAMFIKKVNHTD